ncbi:MAG: transcriptional regulator PpsR [Nevskia sp.]
MSRQPADVADLSALSELAPALADMLVSVTSDIALVVDRSGVIERVSHGGSEPMKAIADEWVGRAWADTVTRETRKKVEDLLKDVAANGVSRARQVNHPSPFGVDVPIAYSAVRLGHGGPLLVVGRDMSVVSAMQQRLVHAQQEMERDYWQRRQADTRYQLLFQIATDPVLVVDSTTFRVIDANRSAARLFERPVERIVGEPATAGLHPESVPAVERLLGGVRVSGHAADTEALLPGQGGRLRLSITPFRSEATTVLLLRLQRVDAEWQTQEAGAKLVSLVGRSPDAVVITDDAGCVLIANPAFLDLAQLQHERDVIGRPLADWLGATRGELPAMLLRLRAEGATRLLATRLRGAGGQALMVELSAARIPCDEDDSFGFIIRAAHDGGAEVRSGIVRPAGPVH